MAIAGRRCALLAGWAGPPTAADGRRLGQPELSPAGRVVAGKHRGALRLARYIDGRRSGPVLAKALSANGVGGGLLCWGVVVRRGRHGR
ncbi:MAG: hypothetical protein ABJD68_15365, partial [Nakamurella sp.]